MGFACVEIERFRAAREALCGKWRPLAAGLVPGVGPARRVEPRGHVLGVDAVERQARLRVRCG